MFESNRPIAHVARDLGAGKAWSTSVFVIDVFSRRIVGWQLATNVRTTLVLDALRMALARRRRGADVELVHHSDAGSQYPSIDFAQVLDDHRVLGSIGSVGDAYDNAMAESFVDSFKTELIADRVWQSFSQLELAIVEWVGWFNHASACTQRSQTSRPPDFEADQAAAPMRADSADRPASPAFIIGRPPFLGPPDVRVG